MQGERPGETPMVPCPWCGGEGYDRVFYAKGHARHIDCGKPVEYTLLNRIRWTLARWFR